MIIFERRLYFKELKVHELVIRTLKDDKGESRLSALINGMSEHNSMKECLPPRIHSRDDTLIAPTEFLLDRWACTIQATIYELVSLQLTMEILL